MGLYPTSTGRDGELLTTTALLEPQGPLYCHCIELAQRSPVCLEDGQTQAR